MIASSAGNSIGAFPGQNKRADMLSDRKCSVNGVCVTWQIEGPKAPSESATGARRELASGYAE